MTLRPYLLVLPLLALVALGCAEATPAPVTAAAPAAEPAPVTEVNLDPPAAPTAKPGTNPDPNIDRAQALRDAQEFSMIGLLNAGAGGDPDAPTAPWGNEDALGNDPMSARGNMWGDSIGDAYGAGGLGLSGVGPSAGGSGGGGIGLGSIGTLGHGAGTGTGQGFGSGSGRLGGAHRSAPPKVKIGATSVSGRLPPEVIQRIVRQNFGRFRFCYEKGLQASPTLRGKVSVRYVIGKDGSTSAVTSAGSDLPNTEVVNCVLKAFSGLSYPAPEGGVVVVVYPIMFEPGDDAAAPKPPAATPAAAPKAPPAPAPKSPPKPAQVDLDEP